MRKNLLGILDNSLIACYLVLGFIGGAFIAILVRC